MIPGLNQKWPLFIPLLSFCSGLVAVWLYKEWVIDWTLFAITVSVLIIISFIISLRPMGWNWRLVSGTLIGLYYFLLGIFALASFQFFNAGVPFHNNYHLLKIESWPEEKARSYGLVATILEKNPKKAHGRLMLFLEKDSASVLLQPGELIVIKKKLVASGPPLNPGEFDYASYLRTRGIQFQTYLSAEQWRRWKTHGPISARLLAGRTTKSLLNKISGWPVGSEAQNLAKALLLGQKKELDRELLTNYAAAGAMHVLAVSGLHTGIFYLVLSLILQPLIRLPNGKMLRSLIIILILWSYAFITGLSASVVRAVTMFSLVAVAMGFKRKTSIYNTLIVSAFLLLIIQPGFLFQAGFQLSYAAVTGIVSLQPGLSRLVKVKNRLLRYPWGIITVSLAAQIATLPLALYYFHQLPGLFLLTNLLLIPLVTLVMYSGLICLLLSACGIALPWPYRLFELLASVMNHSIARIEDTGWYFTGLYLPFIILIGLYLLTFLLNRWFRKGGFRWALLSLGLALVMVAWGLLRFGELKQAKVMVYSDTNHTSIALYQGGEGFVFTDRTNENELADLKYKLGGDWLKYGVQQTKYLKLNDDLRNKHLLKQSQWLMANKEIYYLYRQDAPSVDTACNWIVIAGSPPNREPRARPRIIILGSAVKSRAQRQWRIWCSEKEIPCWDVREHGAWQNKSTVSLKYLLSLLLCFFLFPTAPGLPQ